MQMRNLVLATDFSPDSEAALEKVIELAELAGATVHIVHAFFVSFSYRPSADALPPHGWLASVQAEASSCAVALAKRLANAGIASEIHLVHTDAVTAILRLAHTLPADLIVMGTRGLTGFKRALLGSVAERVVRLAPCPVLTAKHGAP
jgi:universal stress protein A